VEGPALYVSGVGKRSDPLDMRYRFRGMPLTDDQLRDIVSELARRPGHEQVRVHLHRLLTDALDIPVADVRLEDPLPEVRGFVDALVGRTVVEIKRDLRRETHDAEEQLTRYLEDREAQTGERYLGLATDGATFAPYRLQDAQLVALPTFTVSRDRPRDLLRWLDSTVAVRPELAPDPETVRAALGKESIAWQVARVELSKLWEEVRERPDVQLKRDLWADLLQIVYGSRVDADDLFFQHTYLTVAAKTLAARVLSLEPANAAELLSGKPFHDVGITGAVESDFFDWVLTASGGAEVVDRITRQVSRFRLEGVQQDVLKQLYESLIDPEQRHDLGEYYTPDWLAARICERAITEPLSQRVLDPACGSGTFLFHAVRRLLDAADEAGLSNREALATCCARVRGIDVHPVAAIIARVTYLLALGKERLRERPSALSVPVYLGESLQWNVQAILGTARVEIPVPKGPTLYFPFSVTSDPALFDAAVDAMMSLSTRSAPGTDFAAWLQLRGVADEADRDVLVKTYEQLRTLREEDRNHVWGYVARNLGRPIWLASHDELSDVVVGNPPWLSYRYMSREMQERFRRECRERGLWAGGRFATHQDLSAYFFARSVELYVKAGGAIAFVMPYATLTRTAYGGFRSGRYRVAGTSVRFTEGWAFDERVQPLFEVPSCVLFAVQGEPGPPPDTIRAYAGELPRRDASPEQAAAALRFTDRPWPTEREEVEGPYEGKFRQGATLVPRFLCFVDEAPAGALGANPAAPLVQSHRSSQEKPPWKDLRGLRGRIEAEFLRPVYLGESVLPFRVLSPLKGVIPWDGELRDAVAARHAGYLDLAGWMEEAETVWNTHSANRLSLLERWDYNGELRAQFPIPAVRIVYSKAGTLPAAALLTDPGGVIDHKLYWAALPTEEARYLEAILNSDLLRRLVEPLQSRGQWGPRDFDKYVLEKIPAYRVDDPAHAELVRLAERAENIAAGIDIPAGMRFVRARRLVRQTLQSEGVAGEIEKLVEGVMGS